MGMTLFQDLEARGIVKQVTSPELAIQLEAGPMTLYAGFDPTSDALHVGSLLPLLTLRRFQLAGHKPIALVGGATGMIGDPSGKSSERSLLDEPQLEKNLAGIRKVIEKFLDFKGPNAAKIVNNADWFKDFSYIGFLRDVGKHFTVNHMMAKESVRARLEDREHGISYTEFSYMLLQAYDFKFLHDREGCRLQIGGSDQWGNITAGGELIRRMHAAHSSNPAEAESPDVFGLTHPLVSKADGTKFGKSEQGTVWLDATKTSPYRFYQFFIQTQDADVMTYLKFFTFLSHAQLSELEQSLKTEPEKRLAQTTLAQEVTKLVHGEAELRRAENASQALFGAGIRDLDEATLLDVLGGAPSTRKSRDSLNATPESAGLALVDLLVDTQLCPSKGQARKDLAAGGVYVNNERVSDPAAVVRAQDLIAGKHLVLRKGKKNYHLVSFG
jgi:tyrosyl-tRNA synthetase